MTYDPTWEHPRLEWMGLRPAGNKLLLKDEVFREVVGRLYPELIENPPRPTTKDSFRYSMSPHEANELEREILHKSWTTGYVMIREPLDAIEPGLGEYISDRLRMVDEVSKIQAGWVSDLEDAVKSLKAEIEELKKK